MISYTKKFEPGAVAQEETKKFKIQKVMEHGNADSNTDLYSVCLIWVEIIIKEKFWLRGDQPSITTKLKSFIYEIKNTDKYSSFKGYKNFVTSILDLIFPVLSGEVTTIKAFSREYFKIVDRFFNKKSLELWEPFVGLA